MAREKKTDEAKIRAHAAKFGFSPAAVDALVTILLKIGRAAIDAFLARRPPKVSSVTINATPEALDAEREAIERSFAHALGHGQPDAEPQDGPPRMAGPATEALVAMAMRSLLDLAGRSVDAASKAIVAVVDRYVQTP